MLGVLTWRNGWHIVLGMTYTTQASSLKIGDQIREDIGKPFVTVIEREVFKRGTRIWVRLENGIERTFCSATSIVINR